MTSGVLTRGGYSGNYLIYGTNSSIRKIVKAKRKQGVVKKKKKPYMSVFYSPRYKMLFVPYRVCHFCHAVFPTSQ
jgi:hypothetical protein